VKALLSLFAAIRPQPENAVPNSAVQMHFLPNRECRLATSAKDSSPRSAEMAAEGVLISSMVLALFSSGFGNHRLTPRRSISRAAQSTWPLELTSVAIG
jgi:hypothetical protein